MIYWMIVYVIDYACVLMNMITDGCYCTCCEWRCITKITLG